MSGDNLPTLTAAGGVPWRDNGANVLVAVVHRPRYADWSLPKGKLHRRETALLAATREVAEETGARVEVGRRLIGVEYQFGSSLKQVSYWAMRYLGGAFVPSDEVDQMEWLSVAAAADRLTQPLDRDVLADFEKLPVATTTVLLIRHASAGKQSAFKGDDRLRPLDEVGQQQARDMVDVLMTFNPQRILSADRLRCEQTVRPLADRLVLPVTSVPEFAEEAYWADPDGAIQSLLACGRSPGTTVICSQGGAIPGMLSDLAAPSTAYPSRKGSLWALSFYRDSVIAADYYPRPAS
jgi:8-oxo-dGTP diphosphatase